MSRPLKLILTFFLSIYIIFFANEFTLWILILILPLLYWSFKHKKEDLPPGSVVFSSRLRPRL